MQISHESIYTYIYTIAKGALKKELISYLFQQKRIGAMSVRPTPWNSARALSSNGKNPIHGLDGVIFDAKLCIEVRQGAES